MFSQAEFFEKAAPILRGLYAGRDMDAVSARYGAAIDEFEKLYGKAERLSVFSVAGRSEICGNPHRPQSRKSARRLHRPRHYCGRCENGRRHHPHQKAPASPRMPSMPLLFPPSKRKKENPPRSFAASATDLPKTDMPSAASSLIRPPIFSAARDFPPRRRSRTWSARF